MFSLSLEADRIRWEETLSRVCFFFFGWFLCTGCWLLLEMYGDIHCNLMGWLFTVCAYLHNVSFQLCFERKSTARLSIWHCC